MKTQKQTFCQKTSRFQQAWEWGKMDAHQHLSLSPILVQSLSIFRMAVLSDYVWIPWCCAVVAFFCAFGIGIV